MLNQEPSQGKELTTMPAATKAKPSGSSFIEKVQESIGSERVFVFCKVGSLPLEWPISENGMPKVDDADAVPMGGGKVKFINRREFRNIETRFSDEKGTGAQSRGFMELDMGSSVRKKGETDAEFLTRIEDWIANSGDPRITDPRIDVRIERGNPFPIPFGQWDSLKADTIIDTVATAYLGDDHAANLEMLKQFAGYELRRTDADGNPAARQDVLDGLEMLADETGDESDDTATVADES